MRGDVADRQPHDVGLPVQNICAMALCYTVDFAPLP